MTNDTARHDFAEVLALVQDQMRDLAQLQEKRRLLTATAYAADNTVEVTVDAQRMVTKVVIDESYLEDFEFADLGEIIAGAAREAAEDVERQGAALLAPMTERRGEISALSGAIIDVPEFPEALANLTSMALPVGPSDVRPDDESTFPIVRR
jgi:DNA-binding protein YbaB